MPSQSPRRRTAAVRRVVAVLAIVAAVVTGPVLGALPATAARAIAATAASRHHFDADHMGSGLTARTSPAVRSAATTRSLAAGAGGVPGMDVSGWQGNVNWAGAYAAGARFAVVKATEGTGYVNPYFAQQYNGSAGVRMIRGAYHFALPNNSSGTAQADFFVRHGGGWSADGITLPPTLDIEYNPYGATCYRLSARSMVAWIRAFVDEVRARTGRWPMIYTTLGWWSQCTGNSAAFGADPLWIARYRSSPGALPAGWAAPTVWQYASDGRFPGDQDSFVGTFAGLAAFATATSPTPDTVSAVLPSRLAVGGASIVVPVVVTCGEPQSRVTVSLRVGASGSTTATTTFTSSTPTSRFAGSLRLTGAQIGAWGRHRWVVTTPDPAATTTVDLLIRARSVLGLRATRRGSTVTVTGAARAYHISTGRYSAWVGHQVAIQRWTRSGWVTVAGARTDGRGNLRVALHLGFTTGLRLIDGAGATIWGATSSSLTV